MSDHVPLVFRKRWAQRLYYFTYVVRSRYEEIKAERKFFDAHHFYADQEGQDSPLTNRIHHVFHSLVIHNDQGWPAIDGNPPSRKNKISDHDKSYDPRSDYYVSFVQMLNLLGADFESDEETVGEGFKDNESAIVRMLIFFLDPDNGYYKFFCPQYFEQGTDGQEIRAIRDHTSLYQIMLAFESIWQFAQRSLQEGSVSDDEITHYEDVIEITQTMAYAMEQVLQSRPADHQWNFTPKYSNRITNVIPQNAYGIAPKLDYGQSHRALLSLRARLAIDHIQPWNVREDTNPFYAMRESHDFQSWFQRQDLSAPYDPDRFKNWSRDQFMSLNDHLLSFWEHCHFLDREDISRMAVISEQLGETPADEGYNHDQLWELTEAFKKIGMDPEFYTRNQEFFDVKIQFAQEGNEDLVDLLPAVVLLERSQNKELTTFQRRHNGILLNQSLFVAIDPQLSMDVLLYYGLDDFNDDDLSYWESTLGSMRSSAAIHGIDWVINRGSAADVALLAAESLLQLQQDSIPDSVWQEIITMDPLVLKAMVNRLSGQGSTKWPTSRDSKMNQRLKVDAQRMQALSRRLKPAQKIWLLGFLDDLLSIESRSQILESGLVDSSVHNGFVKRSEIAGLVEGLNVLSLYQILSEIFEEFVPGFPKGKTQREFWIHALDSGGQNQFCQGLYAHGRFAGRRKNVDRLVGFYGEVNDLSTDVMVMSDDLRDFSLHILASHDWLENDDAYPAYDDLSLKAQSNVDAFHDLDLPEVEKIFFLNSLRSRLEDVYEGQVETVVNRQFQLPHLFPQTKVYVSHTMSPLWMWLWSSDDHKNSSQADIVAELDVVIAQSLYGSENNPGPVKVIDPVSLWHLRYILSQTLMEAYSYEATEEAQDQIYFLETVHRALFGRFVYSQASSLALKSRYNHNLVSQIHDRIEYDDIFSLPVLARHAERQNPQKQESYQDILDMKGGEGRRVLSYMKFAFESYASADSIEETLMHPIQDADSLEVITLGWAHYVDRILNVLRKRNPETIGFSLPYFEKMAPQILESLQRALTHHSRQELKRNVESISGMSHHDLFWMKRDSLDPKEQYDVKREIQRYYERPFTSDHAGDDQIDFLVFWANDFSEDSLNLKAQDWYDFEDYEQWMNGELSYVLGGEDEDFELYEMLNYQLYTNQELAPKNHVKADPTILSSLSDESLPLIWIRLHKVKIRTQQYLDRDLTITSKQKRVLRQIIRILENTISGLDFYYHERMNIS